jgi:hypothetical protein
LRLTRREGEAMIVFGIDMRAQIEAKLIVTGA